MSDLPEELRRLDALEAAWQTRGAGARLEAVRRAGRRLHGTLRDGGSAACVRTADLVTFPYPTTYALQGVATSPAPYVFLRNRMQLVQVEASGRLVTVLVNPTDPERSRKAPYFARLEARYGARASKLLSTVHDSIAGALARWGVAPAEVDYVTYDHLHVQDARGVLALCPRARLLVQQAELDTLAHLHPLQAEWYIPECLAGVAPERIVALDGDVAVGTGLALVRTPGHTAGNHTIVVVTDAGLWTISENGVCVDAYAPGASAIPGVARHARTTGVEVILNANTREASLDQYTSMVLERTLASPVADRPEFPQHFPSSELVRSRLAPGLTPTYTHAAITHGDVRADSTRRALPHQHAS